MKSLLFTALFVAAATTNAQVFKCPDFFPNADTALGTPAGLQGEARVQRSSLSMAYMYVGKLYGEQYLVGPDVEHSNGGMDIQYGFRPEDEKWLVCVYGGNEWSGSKQHIIGPVQLWQKVDAKITSCVLKVRKVKTAGYPQPWRATAECK